MTATETIAMYTALTLGKAATARQRLTEGLANRSVHLTSLMEAVLAAEAEAAPWERLAKRIERHGVREGLARQREEALEVLLQYGGPGVSTSLVTNAARNAEHDGLRRFLAHTEGLEIQDEPTPETVPAAPEPEPTQAPEVTPAQKRTLIAIRDNGVQLQEFKVGRTTVGVECGDRPRKDMVEWVISQGWAQVDTSRSLFQGRPVTLTATGRHVLAS